jgi:hypothetical protein
VGSARWPKRIPGFARVTALAARRNHAPKAHHAAVTRMPRISGEHCAASPCLPRYVARLSPAWFRDERGFSFAFGREQKLRD